MKHASISVEDMKPSLGSRSGQILLIKLLGKTDEGLGLVMTR